ncbi:CbrC family protein [Affinibrenneria salicis]|uniref:CbrC family protein n=1 Tax=Affinibrenneria salicis TaxID=2590031 RepID=A0A5J5FQI3_9GAMM|nr:CbrC family protein [Affinibrenneria salicis]KAA8995242.1 CbrC family protein [Affinibrenneria salicis]
MILPVFKYHPDPIATGSIKLSDETCQCCEQQRGAVCTTSIYSRHRVEFICPWCVADGSAAKKYDGQFNDDYPLLEDGIDRDIVVEVSERTPGYVSWQQEVWQSHCNDACEFHGDASKADLQALSGDDLDAFLADNYLDAEIWSRILQGYEDGDVAIYKFRCRHCQKAIFTMDCS